MNEYSNIDHEKLFWAKVDKTDTCWNWTAAKNRGGYGQVTIKQVRFHAHRAAWTFVNGAIPSGMQIDHICHNRGCVNPSHLRPVTHKQNSENLRNETANSSGFRGVYWNKRRGDWEAKVTHNRRSFHVGFFTDFEEAKLAVIAKRTELHTHNTTGFREVAA